MRNDDREQNNVKPYVVMIIVLVILTIAIVILLLLTSKDDDKNKESDSNIPISERKEKEVKRKISFFALQNMTNMFVSYNSSESIYNLLYKDYINENGITTTNAFDMIRKNHYNLVFKAQNYTNVDMSDINKNIYIVNGILLENGMETVKIIDKDYNLIVLLDYDNYTYSIIPEEKEVPGYLSSKQTFSIEKNNINSIPTTSNKSRYDYCELYYNDFVFKVNYLVDDAMDYLSDYDKRQLKTSDVEKMFVGSSVIDECYYDSDIRTYTITDSKNNNIRIKENSIMNYTVYLK